MTERKMIKERLQTLPTKIAVPFRSLLEAEQITEETLNTVLDAGELSQQPHLMLGFAIAYLHLRGQGVPVHDVVSMAKEQGRRISLTWSSKRWQQEHERLSRVSTLERLTKTNAQYDLSKFEAHLPADFSGYFIRSSRRLGMEGLRQRHCVASYHHKIMTGDCAIAAIFVDGQRWTVEMVVTGHSEIPIRIVQIKSRFNQLPSHAVREIIYEILGISANSPLAEAEQTREQNNQYLNVLQCLLPVLRERGVQSVHVDFDGVGDSGSIGQIECTPGEHGDVLNEIIEHPATQRSFEDGRWVSRVHQTRQTLREALEELTYEYLEETGVDWYNNDGGYGELIVDVPQGSVFLDVNVRFTEATNEVHQERDIVTGLDIA